MPESVAHSILKVDKVVLVKAKQISRVEVQVAFFQHVAEPLLLRLLVVARVAHEGRTPSHFPHQEARLTWQTVTQNVASDDLKVYTAFGNVHSLSSSRRTFLTPIFNQTFKMTDGHAMFFKSVPILPVAASTQRPCEFRTGSSFSMSNLINMYGKINWGEKLTFDDDNI